MASQSSPIPDVIIGYVVPFTIRMTKNYLAFRSINLPGLQTVYLVPNQKISRKYYHNDLNCISVKDQSENSYLKAIAKSRADVLIISETLLLSYKKITIPMYYVHHGFSTFHLRISEGSSWSHNFCRRYFGIGVGFPRLVKEFSLDPKRCHNLHGLPQIDYLLELKNLKDANPLPFQIPKTYLPKNLSGDTKVIFYIAGSTPVDKTLQKDFRRSFCKVFGPMLESHPDLHLVIKTKKDYYSRGYNGFWHQEKSKKIFGEALKKKRMTILPVDEAIYDYLFADVVIVQEGGSSLIESLMVNPYTLLVQLTPGTQTNFLKTSKFSDLMICREDQKLQDYLDLILFGSEEEKQEKLLTESYQVERQRFIHYHVGGEPQPVCQKILEMILKDLTQKKSH